MHYVRSGKNLLCTYTRAIRVSFKSDYPVWRENTYAILTIHQFFIKHVKHKAKDKKHVKNTARFLQENF